MARLPGNFPGVIGKVSFNIEIPFYTYFAFYGLT